MPMRICSVSAYLFAVFGVKMRVADDREGVHRSVKRKAKTIQSSRALIIFNVCLCTNFEQILDFCRVLWYNGDDYTIYTREYYLLCAPRIYEIMPFFRQKEGI